VQQDEAHDPAKGFRLYLQQREAGWMPQDGEHINVSVTDLRYGSGAGAVDTRGLGAGGEPEIGQRAAEETQEEILESLKGSDMVFVAGGLGGGTFSGASATVARTAKELGCLTVAVVTKPFYFEGRQRSRIAEAALEDLKKEVDAIIVIPNDRLLSSIDKATTVKNAFATCDEVLRQAVEGISDLITTPGIINIDFADIRTVMETAGSALMGIGMASGENRAVEAAKLAINSPLLDVSIAGAKGVLFSIAGGEDLTMFEIQDAAKVITESIDPEAKIIFGTVRDDKLKKNEIKITVIATGFPEGSVTVGRPAAFDKQPEASIQSISKSAEKEKNKIFHGVIEPRREAEREKIEVKKETKPESRDDDDDWGAVPAFLRRSRLK
jgi:cell division protein FtsZ